MKEIELEALNEAENKWERRVYPASMAYSLLDNQEEKYGRILFRQVENTAKKGVGFGESPAGASVGSLTNPATEKKRTAPKDAIKPPPKPKEAPCGCGKKRKNNGKTPPA